ncbi:hypothetical protein CBW16_02545 [Flavobacteriaceae bacterium JJC]|nr:hypothetical protein CBW16_02545 [Flavobacteriaceae bacterium JJC]
MVFELFLGFFPLFSLFQLPPKGARMGWSYKMQHNGILVSRLQIGKKKIWEMLELGIPNCAKCPDFEP